MKITKKIRDTLCYPATIVQIALYLEIRHPEHDRTFDTILAMFKDLTDGTSREDTTNRVYHAVAREIVIDGYGKTYCDTSVRILNNFLDQYKQLIGDVHPRKLSRTIDRVLYGGRA